MDQIELQQKIAEYYAKLTPQMQTVFSSMQWMEDLKKIVAKYNLNEIQESTLGTETMLVLLGIIHNEEYEEVVRRELALDEMLATNLLNEVDTLILNTIKPQLNSAFEKNNTIEEEVENKKSGDESMQAINSVNWKQAIIDAKAKYGFNLEQLEELEVQVQAIFSGLTKPENFERTIKEKMKLTDEKAIEITNEMNEKVFKKIRTSLMEIVEDERPKEVIKEEEDIILKTAGITMSTSPLELKAGNTLSKDENISEKRDDMLKNVEKPELIINEVKKEEKPEVVKNIFASKLTGNFQMPQEKTEYSLNNMSKSSSKVMPEIITPTAEKAKLPKIDPYRELPE